MNYSDRCLILSFRRFEVDLTWKYFAMVLSSKSCCNSYPRLEIFFNVGRCQKMIQYHCDCIFFHLIVTENKNSDNKIIVFLYFHCIYLDCNLLYSHTRESRHWLDPMEEHWRIDDIKESLWSSRSIPGVLARNLDTIPTSFKYSAPSSSFSKFAPMRSKLLRETDLFLLPLMVTRERRAGLVLT